MKKFMLILLAIIVIAIIGYIGFYYVSMRSVKIPKYTVIKKQGNIEIRDYQSMVIAEVTVSGKRDKAISQGFRLLAGYIFGNNHKVDSKDSTKIAMTAPVMQQASEKIAMTAPVMQQGSGNQWQVRFVMPSQYTMATLPKPNNDKVKIIEVPNEKMVVLRFSGLINTKNILKHQEKLQQYIIEHKLQIEGNAQYAFYNPPWTLPFMRRNEVMYKLAP